MILAVVGCELEDEADELDATEERGYATNAQIFNGLTVQGTSVNGFTVQGITVQGITVQGFTVQGITVQGIGFQSNAFVGTNSSNGAQLGPDFLNVEMDVTVQSAPHKLKFVGRDVVNGVNRYKVKFLNNGQWVNACADTEWAVPIPGSYWNGTTGARTDLAGAFTLACVTGSLGKCVLWGYKPWGPSVQRCNSAGAQCQTVSMRDVHQACTRMVRADFCGDGVPWTFNGNQIDIFDRFTPQIQSRAGNWFFEAGWDPNGATCTGTLRAEWLGFPTCGGNPRPSCSGMDPYGYNETAYITPAQWDAIPGLIVSSHYNPHTTY